MVRIVFHSEYIDTLELFFSETISDLRASGCSVTTSTVCQDKLFSTPAVVPFRSKLTRLLSLPFLYRPLQALLYLFNFSKNHPDSISIVVTPTLIIAAPVISLFTRFRYIVICQGQLEGEGLFISYLYRCLLIFSVLRARVSFSCNLIEKFRWDFFPYTILKSKLQILPWYGVTLSRAKLLSFRSKSNQAKISPNGPISLCYLGRISVSKGCIDLIRAFMHPSLSSYSLTLAGIVESESTFSKLFPDLPPNITISPPVSSSDVPSWLSSFDVFISLSRGESIGSATIEALLCGLPVISYLNSGSCQILRHTVDSFLLNDPSPVSILSAIHFCSNNYESMSTSAQRLSSLHLPKPSFLGSSILSVINHV